MEIQQLHRLFLDSSGISTDTRRIQKDCIFFALKGENFNGNSFASEAIEAGAKFAVIDEKSEKNERFINVSNVLETLQSLASFHRKFLGVPIIALTGSNGKTTTKELLHAVLSKKHKTMATKGNLNNHIGVPLSLLSMTAETEMGIVEMGASHAKEIEFLSGIASPDYGYITNFGKAHLEGFKSLEGVIKAKSELYSFLRKNNRTIFLNYDDPIQKKQGSHARTFSFGNTSEADIYVNYIEESEFAKIATEDHLEIGSKLIGSYNARNMAAAYAIARYFDVPIHQIKEAIEEYTPQNNRSQIIEKASNKIILDAYNANPTSMAAALENIENLSGSPKIAILGDMFELGAISEEEHQELVDKLERSTLDQIILIGENFYRTSSEEKIKKFKNFDDFRAEFDGRKLKNGLILIKGSRGMALERILDLL